MTDERRTHVITDPEQLEALTSPARIDIIVSLESSGPATVRELAERLGRKASSLYYHIEVLERVGLMKSEEVRRPDGRSEALYTLVADRITLKISADDPKAVEGMTRVTAATLRLVAREASRAYGQGWHEDRGRMLASRLRTRLDAPTIEKIGEHLNAIDELIRASGKADSGRLYTWTTMLIPLEAEPDDWPKSSESSSGGAEPAS